MPSATRDPHKWVSTRLARECISNFRTLREMSPTSPPPPPNIPVRMIIASVSNVTGGLTTQYQKEAVSPVARFLNRALGVSLCELLPLFALKSPPFAVVQVGKNVDSSLPTARSTIAMGFLHAGESGNKVLAKRFKSLPREIGVVEG